MILRWAKILCYLRIHAYKTTNIEFGFSPTDRVTTLECKRCGYTIVKGGY
jgi:hypothetical protein